MSRPSKFHNKSLSTHPRPSPGAPAQEAVGPSAPDPLPDTCGTAPRKNSRSALPGVDADARGIAPRKNSRSALPGVDADARGTAPRKNSRSALPGVDADARGTTPRKNSRSASPGVEADARGAAPRKSSRSIGRGRRPRGRRPHRRRSLSRVPASLPRLSPDSPGINGEIALLRSLTNRLLSTRPIDPVQISRCAQLIIRAFSANARAPREITDQQQIDNLIKKVFQKRIADGDIGFYDLVPVRTARPGDKWWPWRELLPLQTRWRYGLIDPDEPWPHEENEQLAEREFIAQSYLDPDFLDDQDDDPDYDEEPPPDSYDPLNNDDLDGDEYPPPDDPPRNDNPDDDENRQNLIVVPAQAGTSTHSPSSNPTHPHRTPTLPSPSGEPPPELTAVPARTETSPPTPTNPDPEPPPAPRIARGRPPP